MPHGRLYLIRVKTRSARECAAQVPLGVRRILHFTVLTPYFLTLARRSTCPLARIPRLNGMRQGMRHKFSCILVGVQ